MAEHHNRGNETSFEHLEREHPHVRVLLDALPESIFFKDGDGRFVLANRALAETMGAREPQDLLGKTDYDFYPREIADEYSADERRIIQTGHKAVERLEPKTAAGASRRSLVTRLPVMDASGKLIGIVGIIRNVTERKKAEESLRRLNRELRAISRCNRILVRANDEETFIKDICDVVCEETGYRMAWVGLAENDELKSIRPVAWAGVEDGYLESLGVSWADTARGRGPAGTAVRDSRVAYVSDVETDPNVALWRESALQHGYHSIVGIPLKDEYGTAFGVLAIYAGEPDAFSDDDIRLLQELADDLSFGLLSLRTRAERKRTEASLRRADARYRSLVEQSLVGVYVIQDGVFSYVNPKLAEIFGYTSEEIIGSSTPFDLTAQEDRARVAENIRKRVEGEEKSVHYAFRGVRKDGTIIDVEAFGTATEVGGHPAIVGTLLDVTERNRAEEQLRRAEERYRSIFENAVEGIFQTAVDGTYRLANPALARICGYASPEELMTSVTDLNRQFYAAPDRRTQFIRWMEEHDAVREFESEVYRRDGSAIWISENAHAIRDKAGKLVGFEGTTLDITDRKRAEEALQNERNLLRTLVDVLPDSIYAKDTECRKTMANSVDVRILGGASEADVLGKTDFDMFPNEVAAAFFADDKSVIQTGKPVIDREEFYLDADGQKRWLLTSKVPLEGAHGEIMGLVGVGRDITERKIREAKIQEQAQLLDIALDAITVRDMRNRIRYWNKSAETSYGWTPEEAIGRDEDELLHRNRSDEVKDALRAVIENGTWVGDLRYATKAGGELLGEARWTLVRDEAGTPRSILCVSTDVTEGRALQAQLLRAQRLESLGTLAGGIAHDLNNVLTPILMGLESLGPFIADPEARESLAAITRSAERGANVVRQVLGFARGVETERGDVRLRDVITEVIGIARETFPKSIELVLRGADDLWSLTGSPTQLHQVLMNLCLNARDAMPDGGRLTISARNVQFDDAYVRAHVDAKPIPYVMVEVEDTGIGMPPEVVDRIFDPFFTTKQPGKGTGLGLSTSLSIVKAHGGFITVYSEVGKGSSLRVYLPAALERPATLPLATPSESQSGNGELILLVDDEEAVRDAIRTVLERNGYRVITAADGTEAVALYVEHRQEVRCMITDMMLPHMDGAATIRTVRRFNPDVKIIATSGLLSNGYVAEARGLGAEAFLTKPYSTETLLRTLGEVLEAEQ